MHRPALLHALRPTPPRFVDFPPSAYPAERYVGQECATIPQRIQRPARGSPRPATNRRDWRHTWQARQTS